MRIITASILILLLFTQSFSQWFVVAIFKINQANVARNACENRFRPSLHCNGNCVLMKKIRQQEKEKQNSGSPEKSELPAILLSSRTFFPVLGQPISFTQSSHFLPLTTGKVVDRSQLVFRPPVS